VGRNRWPLTAARPAELPDLALPPAPMPGRQGPRPLKASWYVGVDTRRAAAVRRRGADRAAPPGPDRERVGSVCRDESRDGQPHCFGVLTECTTRRCPLPPIDEEPDSQTRLMQSSRPAGPTPPSAQPNASLTAMRSRAAPAARGSNWCKATQRLLLAQPAHSWSRANARTAARPREEASTPALASLPSWTNLSSGEPTHRCPTCT